MPGSTLFKAFVLFIALWAPVTQADSGWQPVQETIRKSDKDTRQYQAIRLDNGMTVLLVSDPQAVKSLSALVVPVGSLEDPDDHPGLAHYLEHMTLMGSKKYPQPDSLSEFLKMHGGSHNASTAPYRTGKWKMMRLTGRWTVWRMPSPHRCWIKNMLTGNATP